MSDERYNGWTNYETWAVALWINNDHGWQESVLEDVRLAAEEYREEECSACEGGETHPLPAYRAGEIVRENVERVLELMYDAPGDRENYFTTTFGQVREDIGSLWRVDWDEIGAAFLADVAEQDAYENGEG